MGEVPFGWYHVRAVIVAGIGFFTDSYDIFAINLITSMLGMVFWQADNNGVIPTNVNTAIKAATSGGAVIGQIAFGWLADWIGRRKMYGVELAIIVLATFAQSLIGPSQAVSFTGLLVFWRVVMGIGIGGDYPLSAVITSEFAPTRWRGGMMAAVFSMQGAGQFAAALVTLVTTVGFRESFIHTTRSFSSCDSTCQLAADRAWRIIVGFGAVPACFALYYRITIPETPRYTFDIAHDIEKADADIKAYMNRQKEGLVDPITQQKTKQNIGHHLSQPSASWSDVYHYFKQWKNLKILLGTTLSWFFLDLAFYGLGLNSSTVLSAIGYGSGPTIYDILFNNATGNLILVCAGSIPGYWLSVFAIDTLGRKPIQILGFAILTVLFCIIGFLYHSLSKASLLILYILAQIFFNFGPNTTTFIIPGECFPTRYRSTGHGLSAASGKIGAIIAQVISQPLLTKGEKVGCTGQGCAPWLNHLMQIFALFMLCGTLVSFLVPETRGRTLEELAGEGRSSLDGEEGTRKRWWGLIDGGRPAGFSGAARKSPGLGFVVSGERGGGLGRKKKRVRVGIMTSPELVAMGNGEGKGRRGGSGESEVGFAGQGQGGESEDAGEYRVGGSPLPGWGAGWAVQRGDVGGRGRGQTVESIQLMDVGKLLK
ncbi:H+ symporter protein [Rutstroemia sp. NJR-2017a BVV2]|nr:H+ symporter protein [Rutstroemia sp. NJR-2017a BVV2]